MTRIAVLDDWQGVALEAADWSALQARAEVVVFEEAFADADQAAERLAGFDVILAMRERTAFPEDLVARLPLLRMFGLSGKRAHTIASDAMKARGVTVTWTGGIDTGPATAELALALMLAAARSLPAGDAAVRAGRFMADVPPGMALHGRTLGLVGVGRIGGLVAGYGRALGMEVLGWSPNLTAERAAAAGVASVPKAELFARADVVSLHLVLSSATRGVVGTEDLGRMRPGAILVNTARAGLVDETALLEALTAGRIVAALDVYHQEPLPADHPLTRLPNTVLTPHVGYGVRDVYATFYA
ncbi:MAG: D-2-hydroxyacid dehydrogenase family protein, partial [Pseudomonadota bacterium]